MILMFNLQASVNMIRKPWWHFFHYLRSCVWSHITDHSTKQMSCFSLDEVYLILMASASLPESKRSQYLYDTFLFCCGVLVRHNWIKEYINFFYLLMDSFYNYVKSSNNDEQNIYLLHPLVYFKICCRYFCRWNKVGIVSTIEELVLFQI